MKRVFMTTNRLVVLAVAGLALLVLGTGCSGDKKSANDVSADVTSDAAGDVTESDVEGMDLSEDMGAEDVEVDLAPDLADPEDVAGDTGSDIDDPCDPDPCTVPPPDLYCSEDGTKVMWSTGPGTCSVDEDGQAQCDFAKGSEDCAVDDKVCEDGVCVTQEDPCDPNPCTDAPAPYCEDDGMTAVVAVSPGECTVNDGGDVQCDYVEESTNCADDEKACQDGACVEIEPDCTSHCDCTQGMSCIDGECTLVQPLQFCCGQEGCPYGQTCFDESDVQGSCGLMDGEFTGKIVFNEVLSDGSTDIDPNGGDDSGDSLEDEFIEFVNVSDEAIDLGGFTILEETMPNVPRHTFAPGTVLGPGLAAVVFGGGDATEATATAMFFVANAADPGLPYGLSLNNDGDAVKLLDAAGALVAEFNYGGDSGLEPAFDESLTRLPDKTGEFVPHSQAAGAEGAIFSPGTKLDGTGF